MPNKVGVTTEIATIGTTVPDVTKLSFSTRIELRAAQFALGIGNTIEALQNSALVSAATTRATAIANAR